MATRRYGTSPGEGNTFVTEAVGAATAADTVEITIDIANTEVNDGGSTRTIHREEAIAAIDKIRRHILEGSWPPA
jgi:hypothetical protein